MIAFVWAESKNGTIGNHGGLPWKMPADMHHFKETTINHRILAGRSTYNSFGRPLPKRINMVLTNHDQSEFDDQVVVFNSLDQFLADYRENGDDVYVVGGAQVFKALLPYVDVLYRTVIDAAIDGDTKMPPIDYHKFKLVSQTHYAPDAKNQYPYTFETYQKQS
ncbi:dihydrofolate reductase [Nicoliella lavandulae]|uniref:Dihydrofolate reductase n=1 Tax=Nicoliella lavandulae TaxID=3082954 RepID=A0ABU8SLA8_9LACO